MSALGHSRRSDGQEGFAECPLCLQWRPNLCVVTNRRDVPDSDIRTLIGTAGKKTPPTPVLASFDVPSSALMRSVRALSCGKAATVQYRLAIVSSRPNGSSGQ
jgi:hypothetical protein